MRVIMGEHSYGAPKIIGGHGRIVVGKFTSIADGVKFVTVGHDIENVSTYPFNSKHLRTVWLEAQNIPGHPTNKGDIEIGNDCWIGYEAMIMSGVKISDGAVVAARAVVTKDVRPYEVVGGVPAKHLRYRFGPVTIETLLQIKWWNWPDEKIKKHINWLCTNDVLNFVQEFGD